MKPKALFVLGSLVGGLLTSGAGMGAVLFQDNFDTDAAISILNFNALNNWSVSGGTIDYIRSGGFGITCFGGAGGCVDMDGSTGNAGRITSNQVFSFVTGRTYTLSAQVSGNQRGGLVDFLDAGTDVGSFVGNFGPLASGDPFAPVTLVFTPSSDFSARIFFEGLGGDNIGPILDNVVLSDNQQNGIPEPATLLLAGIGIAAMGLGRRKRD